MQSASRKILVNVTPVCEGQRRRGLHGELRDAILDVLDARVAAVRVVLELDVLVQRVVGVEQRQHVRLRGAGARADQGGARRCGRRQRHGRRSGCNPRQGRRALAGPLQVLMPAKATAVGHQAASFHKILNCGKRINSIIHTNLIHFKGRRLALAPLAKHAQLGFDAVRRAPDRSQPGAPSTPGGRSPGPPRHRYQGRHVVPRQHPRLWPRAAAISRRRSGAARQPARPAPTPTPTPTPTRIPVGGRGSKLRRSSAGAERGSAPANELAPSPTPGGGRRA